MIVPVNQKTGERDMRKIHRAWLVCIGCALLLFCTSGLTINAFTVFQPYIMEFNRFSNTQSSTLITVRSFCSFLSMLLTGVYYKKLSLRTGMALGGLCTVFGFALYGLAASYPQYCAASALVGLGYGFAGMIPITIVIGHWFHEKRTLAISICSCSTGLSTLGIPTILTALVERYGLRTAFFAEAAVILLLTGLSYLLVRSDPASVGLEPYGEGTTLQKKSRAAERPLPGRSYAVLLPMLILMGAVMSVGYSHLAVRIRSNGFDSYTAANAVMISGLMLTGGKLAYGWVSEKIGCCRSNWGFGMLLLAGLVLCSMNWHSSRTVYAASALFGAGLSMTSVGLSAWAGDWCSAEQYDSTVRHFQTAYMAGGLLFSSFPGFLADHVGGSYIPAYQVFLTFSVLIVLCVQGIYLVHTGNIAIRRHA